MSIAIITTTINRNPESYEQYAKQGRLIVAGDMTTHADTEGFVRDLGGVFLGVAEQHDMAPELSDIIGWKSIQRRNMALLSAIREGHDTIITVDDDNIPGADFAESHERILRNDYTATRELHSGDDGPQWLNIGDLVEPPTWQRGTPYGFPVSSQLRPLVDRPDVVVSQSQVLGAPDCDAITRLTDNPEIVSVGPDVIVTPRRHRHFLAWNSQATAYANEYAPLAAVLPFVGRYDDIFATFMARRVLVEHEKSIHIGRPLVTQVRNEHDFTQDLRGEVYGLRNTYAFVEAMEHFEFSNMDIRWMYHELAHLFLEIGILPIKTARFMHAWSASIGGN